MSQSFTAPVEWIGPHEAARRAGRRSVWTVYRALESGELHGHQRKRGGRWQIHPEAVDAWVRGMDGAAACGCQRLQSVKRSA